MTDIYFSLYSKSLWYVCTSYDYSLLFGGSVRRHDMCLYYFFRVWASFLFPKYWAMLLSPHHQHVLLLIVRSNLYIMSIVSRLQMASACFIRCKRKCGSLTYLIAMVCIIIFYCLCEKMKKKKKLHLFCIFGFLACYFYFFKQKKNYFNSFLVEKT